MEMRVQIEQSMGMSLPGEEANKTMSPEMADQIAVKAAQAAQQITQQHQQQAQAQQAQQQMQDPIVQMQQQELQLKQQDLQLKAQKQQIEAAAKADQLSIEKMRIEAQKEIAGMQVAATAQAARDKLEKSQKLEGARLGIDISKHKEQMINQRMQMMSNKEPKAKK